MIGNAGGDDAGGGGGSRAVESRVALKGGLELTTVMRLLPARAVQGATGAAR